MNNNIYLTGLLLELSEIIDIKCTVEWLAYSKCPIKVNYYYDDDYY